MSQGFHLTARLPVLLRTSLSSGSCPAHGKHRSHARPLPGPGQAQTAASLPRAEGTRQRDQVVGHWARTPERLLCRPHCIRTIRESQTGARTALRSQTGEMKAPAAARLLRRLLRTRSDTRRTSVRLVQLCLAATVGRPSDVEGHLPSTKVPPNRWSLSDGQGWSLAMKPPRLLREHHVTN